MKTIRKTIKWMFLLLLAGGAGGGGYAYHVWNQSDEILRQKLLAHLHEIAPDWKVSFPRARFDIQGQIHVYEFSLKASDGSSPLLDIAEVVLTPDRERLADAEPPMRVVRWVNPRLHLERDAGGVWNWRKLAPPKLPRSALPEFHAERMAVSVVCRDAESGASSPTTVEDIRLQLIPSAAREFLVTASAKFSHCDAITAEGKWHVDEGAWNLAGQVKNLTIDGALSKVAADFSPAYRAGLSRLDPLIERLAAGAGPVDSQPRSTALYGGAPATMTSAAAAPAGEASADAIARMGLSVTGDVEFRMTQWRQSADCEYKVAFHLRDGDLKNPPVPFPLREMRGEIVLENQQLQVRDFSAQSGTTRFILERGRVLEQGDGRPADFDLAIASLALDQRVSNLLTGSMKKIYDETHATGEADLRMHLEYNGRDRWDHDCDLAIRNGTAAHEKFRYRIEQIEGTIVRRGDMVDVKLRGRAGTQPVTLAGRIKNPGPEAESLLIIKAAGLPIDERLITACPPKFRTVIEHLHAQGELDGTVRFDRSPGPHQPVVTSVNGRFRNGSINAREFQYPLSAVSGTFHGSGEVWEFEGFHGLHGPAEFSCQGAFRPNREKRPELEMDFSLSGASFDRQLFAALPKDYQDIWTKFSPAGGLNIAGKMLWLAGHTNRPRIVRLDAELSDGRLCLPSFPFAFTDIAARIGFDGKQANILSFSGRHDDVRVRVDGGFAKCEGEDQWRVRLGTEKNPLHIDDLEATPEFRKSLPEKLKKIVDSLNPRGKQSISGELEFCGRKGGDFPMTAAWKTVTVYDGTTMNAGIDLRDIHGEVSFTGTWDGYEANGEGYINLQSVNLLSGYQLTNVKGPVSVKGSQVVLGSRRGTQRDRGRPVSPEHLEARFIEGLLALDAVVDLNEPLRYRLWMTLAKGELKRYAQLYVPGATNLAGEMNGSIELEGEGIKTERLKGTGKLVISPAALYELPVIVKIFNALSFVPPEKRAFDAARFVFDIKGSAVHFGRIDLDGDAIKLGGRGTVYFNGQLNLHFLSRLGRKQVPIPIIHGLVNEFSKGWVSVVVNGTLGHPQTKVVPFQQVDEALRQLLGIREAAPQPRR